MQKQAFRYLVLALMLVMMLTSAAGAAPNDPTAVTVTAIQDITFNRVSPNNTGNNGLLYLQQNLTGDFEADKVGLLKFDLSSVSFPIAKARLNLAAISGPPPGCPIYSDYVSEILLYAAGDNWNEASTWNSAGGFTLRGALKDGLDETSYTAPTHLHWTDEAGLTTGLAAYLEQERQTTDHIASLWIQASGAGARQVMFEDHEGRGNSVGCTGATLKPTLQLSGAVDPLAVDVSSFHAADPAPTWPLYAGLGALALLAVAGVTISRRRALR